MTIGGAPATVVTRREVPPNQSGYPIPLQYLRVVVPPGTLGSARATITSTVTSADALTTVHYVDIQDYSVNDTVNNLLFDRGRQRLYVAGNNAVYVFSVASRSFETPINPPTLSGSKKFIGLALTPDGSQLLITNAADGTIAIVDPDNPSNASVIAVPDRGSAAPFPFPTDVAATSTGKAFVFSNSAAGGCEALVVLDLASQTASYSTDLGTCALGKFTSTSDGKHIYAGNVSNYEWSADTDQWVFHQFPAVPITGVADDQLLTGAGSYVNDSNFKLVSILNIPDVYNDATQNFCTKLTASGSLAYVLQADDVVDSAIGIDIYDVQHGERRDRIELTQNVGFDPYGQMLAMDADGRQLAVTTAANTLDPPTGFAWVNLGSAPLSIGNLSQASGFGGTTVVVRGSGFSAATQLSIDGTAAVTTYVDPSTLNVTMPAHAPGPVAMTVVDSGQSYTLDAAFDYQ